MARPIHAVDEKNVLPAIVVVVEERAARAQRLREQFAAIRGAVVPELNSGCACNVGQVKSQ